MHVWQTTTLYYIKDNVAEREWVDLFLVQRPQDQLPHYARNGTPFTGLMGL